MDYLKAVWRPLFKQFLVIQWTTETFRSLSKASSCIQPYIYLLFSLIQAIITLKMKLILKFFKREGSLFLSAKFEFEFESAE